MPIYEYRCAEAKCQHHFEVLHKIDEVGPETCPKCGQGGITRALNAPAFQLKGSGWYVSDFRDSDKPKTQSGEKPEAQAEKTTDSQEAGSDNKPDNKPKETDSDNSTEASGGTQPKSNNTVPKESGSSAMS